MVNQPKSSAVGLIAPQPMPEGAQDFPGGCRGCWTGRPKDEATVRERSTAWTPCWMRLPPGSTAWLRCWWAKARTASAWWRQRWPTAEVSVCQDAVEARRSSRRALVRRGSWIAAAREPGCLAAPEGIEPAGGCIEDDDLEAAGVSPRELERMMAGPDRDRVRTWLESCRRMRTVFVLRAVAGFSAAETAQLLADAWRGEGCGMEPGGGAGGVPAGVVFAGLATDKGREQGVGKGSRRPWFP